MRSICFTGSPDRCNNPAERGENHIHDGAQHENMKCAEPITKPVVNQTESAIAEAENQPTEKLRRQEGPLHAQKPKNRNRTEKTENHGGGDIALQREAFQEWGVMGNIQPCGENQSQTNTNVNTGAD